MNLKALRKERGLTLKEVAEGTGLPLTSISYWESGERQPSADVLPAIADFYKITVDELLGRPKALISTEEEEEPS